MSDQDIRATYFSWLTHLANRLNTRLPEGRRDCPLPAGSLLQLQHAGLVEFVRLDVRMTPRRELGENPSPDLQRQVRRCPVYVPLPPRQTVEDRKSAVTAEQSLAVLEGIAAVHKEDGLVQSDILDVKRAAWKKAEEAALLREGTYRDEESRKRRTAAQEAQAALGKKTEADQKTRTQKEKDDIAKASAAAASAEDASAAAKKTAEDDKKEAARAGEAAAKAKREADAAQEKADAAQREADLAQEKLAGALEDRSAAEIAIARYSATDADLSGQYRNEGAALGGHVREIPRRFIELLTDQRYEVSAYDIPGSGPTRPAGGLQPYPDFYRSEFQGHDQWGVTSKLDQPKEQKKKLHIAAGVPYAYATSPLEKSQLISTSAKAARSMELALSAVASIQTAGVAGGLDLGYTRESAGIAEAFENKPIVIGFSDRNSPVEREQLAQTDPIYLSTHQAPQVGWVFGPKVQMDTERNALKLVHGFAAHEVSADLSIPGWWPHVRTILETAWIGNLHNTGRPIRLEDETGEGFHRERFIIKLPVNAADLDGLTAYLARNTVGALLPIIDIRHVEPYWLSACTQKVEILVKGFNVWRSSRAFLGGVEADQVSVLPDMEGVAARFDMDKIFATRNEALQGLGLEQGIRLTLWTRNGEGHITMGMEGVRTPGRNGERGSCIARTAIAASRAHDNLAIVSMSPAQICASATNGEILVRAYGPGNRGDRQRPLIAVIQNANVLDDGIVRPISREGGSSQIYRIKFDGGPFGAADRNLELSLTDGEDIAQAPIRLVDCKTSPASVAKTAKLVEPHVVAKAGTGNTLKFTVKIEGIDPALAVQPDLRVGVLPIIPVQGMEYHPSTAAPSLSGDDFEVEMSVASGATGFPERAFKQPQRMRFALLQVLKSGKHEKVADVNGTMVYYPNVAVTEVQVTPPEKITQTGEAITLTFPPFYEQAYPSVSGGTVTAEMQKTAEMEGKAPVLLEVDPDWSRPTLRDDGKTEIPATIKLDGAAAAQTWTGLKKGTYTVDLKIQGDLVPKVASFKVEKPAPPTQQ